MDDRSDSEGSLIEMSHARRHEPLQRTTFLLCRAITANRYYIGRVTIDILHDDVLLEIFDHYVAEAYEYDRVEEWQMLVHVCQKWRYLIFGSPLRLNLRILCSAETPVREKLAPWPPLPIIIRQIGPSKSGEDNIIAALGHDDCVSDIDLAVSKVCYCKASSRRCRRL
jgi:hypothetical protein